LTHPASIGRYTITGELGRGAMGVVYRAMDPALDRPVAIKVIAARTSVVPLSGQELEARFLREARVAARINHPGVVTVHDAGGGRKYLFGGAGTYYVKLSLRDYRTAWVKIVVHPGAAEEYADVDLDLEKLED
jgi:serine/threonine protein kinase